MSAENASVCHATSRPPISKVDDFIGGTVVLMSASLSFVVNGGAAYVANRLPRIRGPFTKLSLSQAVGDCGVLAIYALWTAPTMYSQTPLALSMVGIKVGQLSLFFWYGSAYGMLIVAVNRYYGIAKPHDYEWNFSERVTNILIIAIWMLACLHTLVFFLPGCHYFYDPGYYIWSYDRCTWCGRFNMSFEIYYTGSIFLITFAINMVTFVGLMKTRATAVDTGVSSVEERRRRRRELKFFVQSVINGIMFYLMVLSFNIFSTWSDGKWFYFFTTTLSWEISHASNGWLFLTHGGIRKAFFTFLKSRGKVIVVKPIINSVAPSNVGKT